MSKDVRSSFSRSKAGNPNLPQLLRVVREEPMKLKSYASPITSIFIIGRNEHTTSYSACHPVSLSDRKLRKVQNGSLVPCLASDVEGEGWLAQCCHTPSVARNWCPASPNFPCAFTAQCGHYHLNIQTEKTWLLLAVCFPFRLTQFMETSTPGVRWSYLWNDGSCNNSAATGINDDLWSPETSCQVAVCNDLVPIATKKVGRANARWQLEVPQTHWNPTPTAIPKPCELKQMHITSLHYACLPLPGSKSKWVAKNANGTTSSLNKIMQKINIRHRLTAMSCCWVLLCNRLAPYYLLHKVKVLLFTASRKPCLAVHEEPWYDWPKKKQIRNIWMQNDAAVADVTSAVKWIGSQMTRAAVLPSRRKLVLWPKLSMLP